MLLRRAVLVLLTCTAVAVPMAPAVAEDSRTAWVLPSTSPAVVRRDAPALTQLDVVGVSLTSDGRRLGPVPADSTRLLRTAHAEGLRAELLVNNYSNRLEGFDERAAHRLLSHPARVRRVARSLTGVVERRGWDGVNVDLELVRRGDADGLVLLVRSLQRLMGSRRTVSIDVSARTSLAGYREMGYRLGALGEAADVVVLMTYDYSGPTWSRPGPIGPLAWQRSAVEAALRRVPAERIDLGVAGYGYTWPAAGSGRTGRSVTVRQARRLVAADGAEARWHRRHGEWSARLSDGTRLWWSDRRSYDRRVALAAELGVRGTALWRLGSAGPLA